MPDGAPPRGMVNLWLRCHHRSGSGARRAVAEPVIERNGSVDIEPIRLGAQRLVQELVEREAT